MRIMATPVNIIVQYILLRRDLKKMKNYNDGAIIAQACHASSAILYKTINDDLTKLYFNDLDRMHKIILSVDGGENEFNELSNILKQNSIEHYLWIEQPENIPTAIAVKPYFKKDIEQFFSKFKLYR
jgi:peptidyl-tRNA hydrolase